MGGRVVILGPGLLGGSLALALARRGQTPVVWGRRREPLAFLVGESSRIRAEPDFKAAIDGAHFLVLATPLGVMPALLDRIATLASLAPHATITDVGSVKVSIVQGAERRLEGTGYSFVGSHPMAGSEASGVEAARADLFQDAKCILTPTPGTPEEALEYTREFWIGLGARIHVLGPEEHDRVVAHISHLPHALASLIVHTALAENPSWASFSGGGLRDTTRVASGEPAMWAEILLDNRSAVLEALGQAEGQFQNLRHLLEEGGIEPLQRFLLEAKRIRDTHIVPPRED